MLVLVFIKIDYRGLQEVYSMKGRKRIWTYERIDDLIYQDYLDGKPIADIAEDLGISEIHLRMILHKSRFRTHKQIDYIRNVVDVDNEAGIERSRSEILGIKMKKRKVRKCKVKKKKFDWL
jgi:hypothetical protein